MDLSKFYIYDIETYKEAFTFSIVRADGAHKKTFEVSKYTNQLDRILFCLDYLETNDCYMVGFNNTGFDYPIIHDVMQNKSLKNKSGEKIAEYVWELAQEQINSFKGGQFGRTIKEEKIKQIDLYKINHMDNKAKATSLKMLEFNMRLDTIEDLPFGIEEELTEEKIAKLKYYNEHDVEATRKFFLICLPQVSLRFQLTEKFGINFTNFNDTKIGKEYFINQLEKSIPGSCYKIDSKGRRHINQTKRNHINVKECLFDYYDFEQPAFKAVLKWFRKQVINETKGVFSDITEDELGEVADFAEMEVKRKKFDGEPSEQQRAIFFTRYPKGWIEEQELKATVTIKNPDGTKTKVNKKSYWMCWREATNLNVVIDGFRFDFGTGGIHGSIVDKIVKEQDNWRIVDFDVKSFYPNLAISNRIYPKHLSEKFCDIYQDVYNQRNSYAKGTAENAVLKLALNGVYGDSNNPYSPFYDPQYTMSITIGGQLTLCLLVDMWMRENVRFKMMMANTDGVTVCVHKDHYDKLNEVAKEWERKVKLELESVEYSAMYIRDCNSYIAVYKE